MAAIPTECAYESRARKAYHGSVCFFTVQQAAMDRKRSLRFGPSTMPGCAVATNSTPRLLRWL